jgi:hypothetical protein
MTSCHIGDVREVRMWVSTRRSFREGDAGWSKYVEFIGLPELKEVRSLDSMLNEYVQDCGSCPLESYEDLLAALRCLPLPSGEREYYLLFVDAEHEQAPPAGARCTLLGHDLSDETHTSSVLNCGPWTGELARFTRRLNGYGLLTLDDAVAVKSILPRAWPGEPHANVTVWALYEVEPTRLAHG